MISIDKIFEKYYGKEGEYRNEDYIRCTEAMKEYVTQWKKLASILYVATENTADISGYITIEAQYAMAQYRNQLLLENTENI